MSESAWSLLGLSALLVVMAGWIAASALRLLQRIEAYVPPHGATRGGLARKRGDTFPWGLLPKEVQAALSRRTVLFLFYSDNCDVCSDLSRFLPALVRSYRHVRFVVCSRSVVKRLKVPNVLLITSSDLFRHLGVAAIPHAVKVEQERIIEFGLVNSGEDVESILSAAWERGEEA